MYIIDFFSFFYFRQNLLESITNYPNSQRNELIETMQALHRIIIGTDPRRCYDELCKLHAKFVLIEFFNQFIRFSFSMPPTTNNSQSFNDLIRQSSGLTRLKADKFIVVESTKQEIEQRIEKLTNNI